MKLEELRKKLRKPRGHPHLNRVKIDSKSQITEVTLNGKKSPGFVFNPDPKVMKAFREAGERLDELKERMRRSIRFDK